MTTDILPRRHPVLEVAEFPVEQVVFDPRSNRVHHVRDLAAVVFDACDGVTSVAALAEEIAEATAGDHEAIVGNVRLVLQAFAVEGLLEGTEPEPAPPPCLGCEETSGGRPGRGVRSALHRFGARRPFPRSNRS